MRTGKNLSADFQAVDFSGFPILTNANVPGDQAPAICAALVAGKANIPWKGTGPLPLERMCIDNPEERLNVPLHPTVEAFWRRGVPELAWPARRLPCYADDKGGAKREPGTGG